MLINLINESRKQVNGHSCQICSLLGLVYFLCRLSSADYHSNLLLVLGAVGFVGSQPVMLMLGFKLSSPCW